MNNLKDFDITQIDKDTKVVVFKIDFSQIMDSNSRELTMNHLKYLSDNLEEVGVKLIVVDKSIDIVPLTKELLNSGKLKEV